MENAPTNTPAPHFRYYDLVMAAFVTILLLSNLIGASKPSYVILPVIGEWSFGAGVLFFPVSYICLLYTSPSPRDATLSRMPSSA